MKKALLVFAICSVVLLMAAVAEAAQSEQITITVAVAPNLSVELSSSSVALGTVAIGSTTVSSEPIVVRNNGTGVAEVFSLSHSSSGDWTSGITAGDETYVLNAAFAESTAGASFAQVDSVVSNSVSYDGTENLWFQFMAPTSTATTDAQSITVTVNAQLP